MNSAKVLADLEKLNHASRVQRMVELGRNSAENPKTVKVLEAFGNGNWYERGLAVWAVHGSREGATAVRYCADSSESIRSLARQALVMVGTNAQIRTVLHSASPGVRVEMLRALRRRSRIFPIDAALTYLAERNDPELPVLLPFGSLELVQRHRLLGEDRGGTLFWKRLVRYHARQAAAWLIEQAHNVEAPDPDVLRRVSEVLPVLANADPDQALEVLKAVEPHGLPSTFGAVARFRLYNFTDWYLSLKEPLPFAFAAFGHRLRAEQLNELMRRYPKLFTNPESWLRRLSPEQRVEAFRRCGASWRNETGCLSPALLTLLPRSVREPEAQRHLGLSQLATRPLHACRMAPWRYGTSCRRKLPPG